MFKMFTYCVFRAVMHVIIFASDVCYSTNLRVFTVLFNVSCVCYKATFYLDPNGMVGSFFIQMVSAV